MKPVFCLSRCFGLTHSFHEGTLYKKLNIPLLIYNVALLTVTDSLYIFYATEWLKESVHTVVSFGIILQSVCSVTCNIIAFYVCLVKARYLQDIFNTLSGLHRYLKHPTCMYSEVRRNLILQMVISILGSLISLVVSWQSLGSDVYFIHVYVTFFISETWNVAMELQYIGFVLILRRHFVEVNTFLKTSCRITRRMIVATVKYHDCLCDVVDMVNSFYSLFVLMNVTKMFMSVSCTLFIVLMRHYITDMHEQFGILNLKNQVAPWCVLYIVKLVLLVSDCSSTIQEANKTAVFVHKLAVQTSNPDAKEELDRFSLQLVHRKVDLTAWGFFPLDFTLLYSIVGAVTTYIIVMVQFQLSIECSSQSTQ